MNFITLFAIAFIKMNFYIFGKIQIIVSGQNYFYKNNYNLMMNNLMSSILMTKKIYQIQLYTKKNFIKKKPNL